MISPQSNCIKYYEYSSTNLGIDLGYDIWNVLGKTIMVNIIGDYTLNFIVSYSKCIQYSNYGLRNLWTDFQYHFRILKHIRGNDYPFHIHCYSLSIFPAYLNCVQKVHVVYIFHKYIWFGLNRIYIGELCLNTMQENSGSHIISQTSSFICQYRLIWRYALLPHNRPYSK